MKVDVAHWLTWDGQKYGPGSTADVPPDAAKMMIRDGIIRAGADVKTTPPRRAALTGEEGPELVSLTGSETVQPHEPPPNLAAEGEGGAAAEPG